MVQDFVSHMGRNAQAGHSRYTGSAQIVNAPPTHSRELIQPAFSSTEFLERLHSQQREDKRSPLVGAFQHRERLIGEVHDVSFAILCP